MTDDIAQLKKLTEELDGSGDITKFFNNFLGIIASNNRWRSELFRQLESTPSISRPITPVSTPSSSSAEHVISDTAIDPDLETTVDSSTITRRKSPRHDRRDESAGLKTNGTALGTTPHVAEDSACVQEPCMSPPPAASAEKKRKKVPPSSPTPPPIRRGPGKKQKLLSPHFGQQRFRNLDDALRRQICECTIQSGLQVAWTLVTAFQQQPASSVQIDPSLSRTRQLQYRIINCEKMEKQGNGLMIRATIERRFYEVQLMAEYRKQILKAENAAQVTRKFKEEMFAEQTPNKKSASWDYFIRTATPVFEAVQRYGYGTLIFPLSNVNKKSLQQLNRGATSDFVDYIQACHPEIDGLLCNLSDFLPRLLTWGLPAAHDLPLIAQVSYEQLADLKDEDILSMFCLNGIENHGPGVLDDVPPWPSQVLTQKSVLLSPADSSPSARTPVGCDGAVSGGEIDAQDKPLESDSFPLNEHDSEFRGQADGWRPSRMSDFELS